jgi:hypothetical protein
MSEAQQATPPEELRRQIMSYTEPKNEREWWALHRIEKLESLFPAILEYLEEQADVVDGDSGIPAPNRAMALLVWTRHELEKK